MPIEDFLSINLSGDIRRVGNNHLNSPEYFSVIELHRYLQDKADNPTESGNDFVSIIRSNPSERSTDNIITLNYPYNIDDDLSEYLYDGSIIQHNGSGIYDGFVNFGNTNKMLIIQDGKNLTNDFWNISGGLNKDEEAGISHRFLLKVRESGRDIDGRRIVALSRNYGFTYSEFVVNGTSRGNNVLALSESADLNNQKPINVISGYSDITNIEGYQLIDLNNGAGPQPYYSKWNLGSRNINDLYERAKFLTNYNYTGSLYGINGKIFRGITHQIPVSGASGTFNNVEGLSWGVGSGQILAINNTSNPSNIWIQLLKGIIPSSGHSLTGVSSSATVIVNGSPIKRTNTPVFLGVSTSSAVIGSYGIGINQNDLSSSDSLTDLDNDTNTPPNNQVFTVNGLVVGEDRVLVAQNNGNDEIKLDQFSASGNQLVGQNYLLVTPSIPLDTPISGSIYAYNSASTTYDRIEYSSFASGNAFLLSSSLVNQINSGNNVFIGYIDKLAQNTSESYTATYIGDRSLVVKVRDGGGTPIKPFQSSAIFGAGGGSITVIRTSDS